jgi:hypothetical protein
VALTAGSIVEVGADLCVQQALRDRHGERQLDVIHATRFLPYASVPLHP